MEECLAEGCYAKHILIDAFQSIIEGLLEECVSPQMFWSQS
jgi:hypothetical protein